MADLESAIQHLLKAKRITAPSQSYRKDNPVEYEKVKAYLDGGPRPSGVTTEMGLGLVEVEDVNRAIIPEPPDPIPPDPIPVPSYDIPRWNQNLLVTNGPVGWWRQYKTPNNSLIDGVPQLCTPAPNPRAITGPRSWEWWVLGTVLIPQSFPNTGRAFATINPHNSSYDVGNTGHGGIGWGFGSGVSAWHIFFKNGQTAPDAENDFTLYLNPSPSTNWSIVDNVARGHRYDFTIRVIWGRMDQQLGLNGPGNLGGGIGDHPNNGYGRVWAYVDGELRRDTGNRDTLLRAVNPDDGKTYTQTCAHRCWDGAYCVPNLTANITMERTASRVGRTFSEALNDGRNGFTLHSQWGEGGGSMSDLPPLKSGDFKAPQL